MTNTNKAISASVHNYLSQIGRKGAQAVRGRNSFTTETARAAIAARWAKPGAREAHSAAMRKQALAKARHARMEKAIDMAKAEMAKAKAK